MSVFTKVPVPELDTVPVPGTGTVHICTKVPEQVAVAGTVLGGICTKVPTLVYFCIFLDEATKNAPIKKTICQVIFFDTFECFLTKYPFGHNRTGAIELC